MSPARMSKLEAQTRVVLAFREALNRHDVAAMMQLLSDDCTFEGAGPPPDGTLYSGKEALAQHWESFFRESPQAQIQIEEIFGLGERCVMRWRYTWADPAEQSGHLRGVDLYRVRGGLIRERLSYVKG